jgi:hypothetical protein
MPDASAEAQAQEVAARLAEDRTIAETMEGRLLGLCGFPDWVKDPGGDIPALNMMGCCDDSAVRGAHAAWSETITGDAAETRVNLALNRDSSLVEVISCLPHRGEVNVIVKDAARVLVRVPGWAPQAETNVYVNRKTLPVDWLGPYVVFDRAEAGQHLTVTYPLRMAEVRESINGVEYTEEWRGSTVVDIAPAGKWIPMFQRPQLDTEEVPQ